MSLYIEEILSAIADPFNRSARLASIKQSLDASITMDALYSELLSASKECFLEVVDVMGDLPAAVRSAAACEDNLIIENLLRRGAPLDEAIKGANNPCLQDILLSSDDVLLVITRLADLRHVFNDNFKTIQFLNECHNDEEKQRVQAFIKSNEIGNYTIGIHLRYLTSRMNFQRYIIQESNIIHLPIDTLLRIERLFIKVKNQHVATDDAFFQNHYVKAALQKIDDSLLTDILALIVIHETNPEAFTEVVRFFEQMADAVGNSDPSHILLDSASYLYEMNEVNNLALVLKRVNSIISLIEPSLKMEYIAVCIDLLMICKNDFTMIMDFIESLPFSIEQRICLVKQFDLVVELKKYQFSLENPNHLHFMHVLANAEISSIEELFKQFLFARFQDKLGVVLSDIKTQSDHDKVKFLFDIEDTDQLESKLKPILKELEYMFSLEHGPLDKAADTKFLESVIDMILKTEAQDLITTKNSFNEYEIRFKNTNLTVNISRLLVNANLSHIILSDEQADTIYACLQVYTSSNFKYQIYTFDKDTRIPEPPIKTLPLVLQDALTKYTSSFYSLYNQLLRGESLQLEGSEFANEELNLVVPILLGTLLVSEALRRLPLQLHEESVYVEEKKILQKLWKLKPVHPYEKRYDFRHIKTKEALETVLLDGLSQGLITDVEKNTLMLSFESILPLLGGYTEIYRNESFDDDAIYHYRDKKPYRNSAFTSTSYQYSGFEPVTKRAQVITTAYTNSFANSVPVKSISPHAHENEIILPPGTQVGTVNVNKAGGTVYQAMILSSPAYEKNRYWSELALRQAITHHLSKPYKETDHTISDGKTRIARPNHGEVHTFRVMKCIPLVINYYGSYAKAANFSKFCQLMSPSELELLTIMAAFSVTGRESEVGSSVDLERAKSYRTASADNFSAFFDMIPADCFNEDKEVLRKRCYEVILYMGNPNYETELNSATQYEEKWCRNFYHRILSMAHTIDLPRCWTVATRENYKKAVGYSDQFTVSSEHQREAKYQLERYVCELIALHGDAQEFTTTSPGVYVPCVRRYQPEFFKYSHDVKALTAVTETIDEPLVRVLN